MLFVTHELSEFYKHFHQKVPSVSRSMRLYYEMHVFLLSAWFAVCVGKNYVAFHVYFLLSDLPRGQVIRVLELKEFYRLFCGFL